MPLPPDSMEPTVAAASVMGSAASGLVNRSADGWARKVLDAVAGAAVGVFCGPVVADSVGLTNDHLRMACGFGVGAAGAIALTLFMDWAKSGSLKEWVIKIVTKQP